jgi:hypothetical protein
MEMIQGTVTPFFNVGIFDRKVEVLIYTKLIKVHKVLLLKQ